MNVPSTWSHLWFPVIHMNVLSTRSHLWLTGIHMNVPSTWSHLWFPGINMNVLSTRSHLCFPGIHMNVLSTWPHLWFPGSNMNVRSTWPHLWFPGIHMNVPSTWSHLWFPGSNMNVLSTWSHLWFPGIHMNVLSTWSHLWFPGINMNVQSTWSHLWFPGIHMMSQAPGLTCDFQGSIWCPKHLVSPVISRDPYECPEHLVSSLISRDPYECPEHLVSPLVSRDPYECLNWIFSVSQWWYFEFYCILYFCLRQKANWRKYLGMIGMQSPVKIRQIWDKDCSQQVEHMQVPKLDGLGVWRSERPLWACHTCRKHTMRNSIWQFSFAVTFLDRFFQCLWIGKPVLKCWIENVYEKFIQVFAKRLCQCVWEVQTIVCW